MSILLLPLAALAIVVLIVFAVPALHKYLEMDQPVAKCIGWVLLSSGVACMGYTFIWALAGQQPTFSTAPTLVVGFVVFCAGILWWILYRVLKKGDRTPPQ